MFLFAKATGAGMMPPQFFFISVLGMSFFLYFGFGAWVSNGDFFFLLLAYPMQWLLFIVGHVLAILSFVISPLDQVALDIKVAYENILYWPPEDLALYTVIPAYIVGELFALGIGASLENSNN